jgi:catechol 2,3-dioxygenase-like lactoylglutathione lyase family enzyme
MAESPARPIHHIGYWVDDLEQSIERAQAELGVGPFWVHEHITFEAFRMAGRSDAESVVFDHSAAFTAWGPIVLEYGQVHAVDDELARLYGVRTGAVSHVSWLAEDLATERERLAAFGCAFINSAATGPVSVEWVSGGSLFGHPIEVHLDTEFMRGMHGRLIALGDE